MDPIVFGLISGVVCAFLGARVARSKNRHPAIGVVLGFCLGLIGLLIVALIPKNKRFEQVGAAAYQAAPQEPQEQTYWTAPRTQA